MSKVSPTRPEMGGEENTGLNQRELGENGPDGRGGRRCPACGSLMKIPTGKRRCQACSLGACQETT